MDIKGDCRIIGLTLLIESRRYSSMNMHIDCRIIAVAVIFQTTFIRGISCILLSLEAQFIWKEIVVMTTICWKMSRWWRERCVHCRTILYNEYCRHAHSQMEFIVAMHEPYSCKSYKTSIRSDSVDFETRLTQINLTHTWIVRNKSDGSPPKIWDKNGVLHWWIHQVVFCNIFRGVEVTKPLCKKDHVVTM